MALQSFPTRGPADLPHSTAVGPRSVSALHRTQLSPTVFRPPAVLCSALHGAARCPAPHHQVMVIRSQRPKHLRGDTFSKSRPKQAFAALPAWAPRFPAGDRICPVHRQHFPCCLSPLPGMQFYISHIQLSFNMVKDSQC